jgi:hypothetical protein
MSTKRRNIPHAKSKALSPPGPVERSLRQHRTTSIALKDVLLNQPEELAEQRMPRRRASSQNDSDWGRGDERRLNRLLGFVQRTDLKRLSEHDLEQLQYELAAFGMADGRDKVGIGNSREMLMPSGPLYFGRRKLSNLAKRLRTSIYSALKGEPFGPVTVKRTIEYDPKGKEAYEYFSGNAESLISWAAQTIVLRRAGEIHTCVTPGCGRLFIKVKRQTRCSAQCAQMEYSKKYRTNPANKEKISDKRHLAYKKKVEKEQGPKVAEIVWRHHRQPNKPLPVG